ncbi:hypothetical protein [Hydrogenophaga sp. 5NK40-0174]|uniref:hypothetical protein n=1 Tax=Hydrogenophaga sp. 5NK40-0174 TaxID=3127649 RepID=UPI00310BBE62
MLTTTFGYHAVQDRIWMTLRQPSERLWLTRRMAVYLLGAMTDQLERSTPGQQAGGDAPTRARIEHELAFNEVVEPRAQDKGEQPAAPQALKLGKETREQTDQAQYLLCERIRTTMTPEGQCVLTFMVGSDGQRVLRLSRSGLHRWLRALLMVARQAKWLEALQPPDWLQQTLLPPSMQAMLRLPPESEAGDNGKVDGSNPQA